MGVIFLLLEPLFERGGQLDCDGIFMRYYQSYQLSEYAGEFLMFLGLNGRRLLGFNSSQTCSESVVFMNKVQGAPGPSHPQTDDGFNSASILLKYI